MAEATGLEPASDERDDLANRCHTVRRHLQGESQISNVRTKSFWPREPF